MKFSTKKDLLRYLGKNEDDRKLIDRMVARGEVKVEGRLYVIEDKKTSETDLEYLNKEYEKLEGLLDYSLRKCYNIMRKRGLISSDDTYDNFYENITEGYNEDYNISDENERKGEDTESSKADLNEVLKKFNL
jgi:hypothetical protein